MDEANSKLISLKTLNDEKMTDEKLYIESESLKSIRIKS